MNTGLKLNVLTDDEATIISRHILELPRDIDLPSMQAPMLIGIIPPADVGVDRVAAPVQTLTGCKNTPLFSKLFVYVCPEPVLVK